MTHNQAEQMMTRDYFRHSIQVATKELPLLVFCGEGPTAISATLLNLAMTPTELVPNFSLNGTIIKALESSIRSVYRKENDSTYEGSLYIMHQQTYIVPLEEYLPESVRKGSARMQPLSVIVSQLLVKPKQKKEKKNNTTQIITRSSSQSPTKTENFDYVAYFKKANSQSFGDDNGSPDQIMEINLTPTTPQKNFSGMFNGDLFQSDICPTNLHEIFSYPQPQVNLVHSTTSNMMIDEDHDLYLGMDFMNSPPLSNQSSQSYE